MTRQHPLLLTLLLAGSTTVVMAGTADLASGTEGVETRYGLFDGLDHRSSYGTGIFPETFAVGDSDLEDGEMRLDWTYARSASHERSHVVTAEFEQGFGELTLELDVPYEIDTTPHSFTKGFDSLGVSARCPFYQFVWSEGFFDTTFGAGAQVGLPLRTTFSRNTDLAPRVFNDTRLGSFTLQTVLGGSLLRGGGGPDQGLNNLEYGCMAGYLIEKPLDAVDQLIPVCELVGEHQLNHAEAGRDNVSADVGFRINLKAVGGWQPRLGLAYAFPLSKGAREIAHSGLFTNLVFDF